MAVKIVATVTESTRTVRGAGIPYESTHRYGRLWLNIPVGTELVTHADYKALEDKCDFFVGMAVGDIAKYAEMQGQVERLTAELAECRKDAERIDYLGANCTGASDSERYLPFRIYWGSGKNKTIREAIDNAIARTKT